jgi:hypothetical protein
LCGQENKHKKTFKAHNTFNESKGKTTSFYAYTVFVFFFLFLI